MDITLPDKGGVDLIKDLKAVRPGLKIQVISMHDKSLYAERALRAGARGCITKQEGGVKLMQAIRQVLSGQISVSEKTFGADCGNLFEERIGRRPIADRAAQRPRV